jgi:hypothetical protein
MIVISTKTLTTTFFLVYESYRKMSMCFLNEELDLGKATKTHHKGSPKKRKTLRLNVLELF